jgi:hypothetical protein
VTGRVTDAEKNWAVIGLSESKRLLAPWIPVNRIFGMLKQIWARFLTQSIGHGDSSQAGILSIQAEIKSTRALQREASMIR